MKISARLSDLSGHMSHATLYGYTGQIRGMKLYINCINEDNCSTTLASLSETQVDINVEIWVSKSRKERVGRGRRDYCYAQSQYIISVFLHVFVFDVSSHKYVVF